ncbi:MAG: response regulator transcription factor [Desulfovibrio sp.]|uniref:response regulator n=1 Tax=Desulfovibrio sp. TaxID=885 RepID=UPI0039E6767B
MPHNTLFQAAPNEQQHIETTERILVVEDDKAIRALVTTTLENHGMAFLSAATGREAITATSAANPDVILLDLGLPDMDGVDIIRAVRQWTMTPIIVLSARSEDDDKVAALDAGADDYLTKPFSVDELLARLRAALRRTRYERGNMNRDRSIFENGSLHIDYAAGCVTVEGQEVHLAPMEYKLLCLLARNAGKVLTHRTILQSVWGNVLPQNLPSLRVFMATLRKKLEAISPRCNYIHTHVGVGYRMGRLETPPEM